MKNTKSLKDKHEIKKMLYRAKYLSSSRIVIYIIKNNLENKNLFAVCVGKKNGNSVHRNRLKRWAREAIKEIETNIKKGYNILVLYKKTSNVDNCKFLDIKMEILESLKKLEMLKGSENEENCN